MGFRDCDPYQGNAEQPEWYVNPENCVPVHAFYYGAADKGTECYTESSDSSPDANSSSTQPLGYGSTQQCKGKRHNGRAADSLKSTGRDEGTDIITDTAPCRGGSKYKDSK